MKDKENDKKEKDSLNQAELDRNLILEDVKNKIYPIQQNLSEKKITIDEVKDELIKINERLQSTNLEKNDKETIGKAFDKLTKLERTIDENILKNELNEIINLLERLIRKELTSLYSVIKYQNYFYGIKNRPFGAQIGIMDAREKLRSIIHDAKEDKNLIARMVGNIMESLIDDSIT